MRTRRRLLSAAVTAVLAGVAGCAQQPATPRPSATAAFGGTDRAWIEITIAMDEQVRPLLDLVAARAADPALRARAARVRALVESELGALRLLHDAAGLPAANPHTAMVMPGLVTADQVARAGALRGAAFDAFASTNLDEYLTHGADLARSEAANGQEPRTKALATTAVRLRGGELS